MPKILVDHIVRLAEIADRLTERSSSSMRKATEQNAMHLEIDRTTDTVIVPDGVTFADLCAAWAKQHAYVQHLMEIYDKPYETDEEKAHCEREIDQKRLVEQAVYEASETITTTDELLMLAKVDLSFEDCYHEYPQCLSMAVIRIAAA